jgi:protein-disulfide isomerase
MKDEREIFRLARDADESDHVQGPESAPVTLVEYGDYECPHCRQLHPIIREIMRRTEGVRFVYRHFPLSNLHPNAVRAAESAEAAGAQGRFWEMHDLLFEHNPPLEAEPLARLAGKAGLDMQRYAAEMAEGAYSGKVEEGFKSALYGEGVTGTPTVYLNGVRVSNLQGVDDLLAAVTEAGATIRADSREHASWLTRLRNFRPGMTRLK